MSLAHLAQPGILEPIPAHGRYLTCQLRVGADPRTVITRLASQADGQATVVGLGLSLVRELGAQIHRVSVSFNLPAKISRRYRER